MDVGLGRENLRCHVNPPLVDGIDSIMISVFLPLSPATRGRFLPPAWILPVLCAVGRAVLAAVGAAAALATAGAQIRQLAERAALAAPGAQIRQLAGRAALVDMSVWLEIPGPGRRAGRPKAGD